MNIEFKNGDKSLKLEFKDRKFIGVTSLVGIQHIELTDEQIKALSVALNHWVEKNK